MTDKIKPALTPEEWETGRISGHSWDGDEHAAMALANAALPDDDPRKITREDLKALCAKGHPESDVYHPDGLCCNPRLREERLRALAAKLAALLPPE